MVVGKFPLKGKTAVVTGGGSGINLAFVRLAVENGCRCLIADLKLLPEAQEFVESSGGKAVFTKCDVSNWKDLEKLPKEVESAFGSGEVADVWVAGAGVFEPQWSSWLYDTEDDYYRTLQINSAHPIKLSRIATRSLLGANKKGVVVIVASMAAVLGQYASALYCASKHAVAGFTKSMGQLDIDESIAIKCICPGMVATPLWKNADVAAKAAQFSYTDDMCVTAEQVAEAMKQLVEDGERWKGGSLMEVGKDVPDKDNVREVDGRGGDATLKLGAGPGMKAWTDRNFAPIREVFAKEKGVGSTNGLATQLSSS